MRKLHCLLMGILLLIGQALSAQTRQVTGKITDATGLPIPNATIKIKGSRAGTSAASDGTFTLQVKPDATLQVSAIGYETRDFAAGSSSTITISLTAENKSLSEVVVTGIGTATSKKKVAISVQSISSDKLPSVPGASIDQALVGKIAGAQISSSSGNPGSPVSIQLRGPNTIEGGSQPMILVDGVEMASSTLSTLDLNMVDKIEVVQGSASATIYGAQGANGVINIFTKKGKAGTAHIDLSSRVSWDSYINVGHLHQPLNHSFQVDNKGDIVQQQTNGTFVPLSMDSTGVWGHPLWQSDASAQNNKPYKDNTAYSDHIRQLFRNAKTTNHSILISGGKDKSDYAISISRLDQESIIDGSLKRTNFTINTGFEVFKNFKVRGITQVAYTESSLGNRQISSALYTYPFADFTFKDPNGNSPFKFGDGAGANSSNPYYYKQYQHYNDRTWDIIPSINVSYKLPKFLDLDYKYSINLDYDDYQRRTDNQSLNLSSLAHQDAGWFVGEGLTGGIYNPITKYLSQNSLATANLKFDLDGDFKLNVPLVSTTTVAYDWRKKSTEQTVTEYTGLPLLAANANQADVKSINSVYQDKFVTYGYFVNERLDWADIGGVSAGFRSDYASTFGEATKPQTFYRGDAYLLLSSFGFWKPMTWWPAAKIRAAYGEAGIQPGVFDRIPTLVPQSFDNGSGLYNQSQAANPDLTVEVSKEKEIGTDLVFRPSQGSWFSSINVAATYWTKTSKNVIWIVPLAISTGASTIKTNAIDWSSKGYEFSIDMDIYKARNLRWNMNTTFGHYTAIIQNIHGAPDIPLVWANAATYTLKTGQAVGTVFGYKALTKVDETDPSGSPYIAKADQGNYQIVAGRVVDTASKKVQFTGDKRYLGNTTPKFNMSFTNTITFKDYLTLSFQFDWYYKSMQYNQTKEWMYSEGLHGDFDKPITINGQTGAWVSYYKSFYDAVESNGTKDFFLESSSFLRLRNISLSYDVARFVKIPFVNRLQLVVSGRNIWTSTKYTGMDPEANQNTSGSGSVGTTQTTVQKGLDYFSFPNTKSYQVGLNIGLN